MYDQFVSYQMQIVQQIRVCKPVLSGGDAFRASNFRILGQNG